jgi:hypothetical protein
MKDRRGFLPVRREGLIVPIREIGGGKKRGAINFGAAIHARRL